MISNAGGLLTLKQNAFGQMKLGVSEYYVATIIVNSGFRFPLAEKIAELTAQDVSEIDLPVMLDAGANTYEALLVALATLISNYLNYINKLPEEARQIGIDFLNQLLELKSSTISGAVQDVLIAMAFRSAAVFTATLNAEIET